MSLAQCASVRVNVNVNVKPSKMRENFVNTFQFGVPASGRSMRFNLAQKDID